MAVDDLSDIYAELRRLRKDVTRLMASTMLQDSSITRGRLRIASEEGLLVEGSARVSGRFFGEGTFEWTGPESHTGDESHDGTITISGDMNVVDDGKVSVGTAMVLTPAADGGGIVFNNGAKVSGATGGVGLFGNGSNPGPAVISTPSGSIVKGTGNAAVEVSSGVVIDGGGGGRSIVIASGTTRITGLSGAPVGTATFPLVTDNAGNVYKG